jgi:hypothetical protein
VERLDDPSITRLLSVPIVLLRLTTVFAKAREKNKKKAKWSKSANLEGKE